MSDDGKNHYELLGVARSASKDEIKVAYKELARLYHPDSHHFDEIVQSELTPEQEAVFKIITAAYNTLIHEQKRREYDEILPPELRSWESDSSEFWHKGEVPEMPGEVTSQRARSQSFAMGTFGRAAPGGGSQEPEMATGKPRRKGILRGILSRLRSL